MPLKSVWGGEVDREEILSQGPVCMILGTSGVIWGNLGSDFSDFRIQNHSV